MSRKRKDEELYLIEPLMEHKEAFNEMLIEFEEAKERVYPRTLRPKGMDYSNLIKKLESYRNVEACPPHRVPSDTYFLVNKYNKLLGAITIRHYLNEELLKFDGHIGYGIRPTERGKGYAKTMLKMALKVCEDRGMKRILVTCNKDNIASAKTIIANGGVFENEMVEDNGTIIKRYWIGL
jgi:predicted acetyltransferase